MQGYYQQQQQQQQYCVPPQQVCQPPPVCQPSPPPCAPSTSISAGISFGGLFDHSKRCTGVPTYTLPCPEQVVYQDCPPPPPPCQPQQVCQQISSNMQEQQQQNIQNQYGSPLTSETSKAPLQLTAKENRSTRRLLIVITGSLAGFQRNPNAAKWFLENEHTLKRKVTSKIGGPREGNLERTVVLDARVFWTHSTCPKTVMAVTPAFRGNTYNSFGTRGFLAIPPGRIVYSGEDGKGLEVMRPHVIVGSTLMSSYGHLSEESIRAPLTPVKGGEFTLVPGNHEVMRIVSLNAPTLGIDMNKYTSMCGNQFPVTNELVEKCISQIKEQVLDIAPWSDMRKQKFEVGIVPADSKDGQNNWASTELISGIGVGFVSDKVTSRILNTPFTVQIYMGITYAIADEIFARTKDESKTS